MTRHVALLPVLGLLLASAGHADSWELEPRWEPADFYLVAGGAYSWLVRAEDELSSSGISNETGPSYGGALTYGVRLNAPVSIEIDFEWLHGHEFEQSSALGVRRDDISMYSLTSNLAFRPVVDRFFDPFVSIGGGWMRAELHDFGTTGDGMALRAAIGTDLWLSRHVGLRLSGRYMFPFTTEIENLDTISPRVGLLYRF